MNIVANIVASVIAEETKTHYKFDDYVNNKSEFTPEDRVYLLNNIAYRLLDIAEEINKKYHKKLSENT